MQYMLLIYNDENQGAGASEEERGAMMQAYMAYTGRIARRRGHGGRRSPAAVVDRHSGPGPR